MFKGKIVSGCWDEETIELSGMPKDFILSARELVVLETKEHDALVEAMEDTLVAIPGALVAFEKGHKHKGAEWLEEAFKRIEAALDAAKKG